MICICSCKSDRMQSWRGNDFHITAPLLGEIHIPDSKVHGANMGPTWGRQDPGGPQIGPMNFGIWDIICGSPHLGQVIRIADVFFDASISRFWTSSQIFFEAPWCSGYVKVIFIT